MKKSKIFAIILNNTIFVWHWFEMLFEKGYCWM